MKRYEKYKSSNIEWIENIPEHWGKSRIKFDTYVKGRIGWHGLKSDEFIDEGPYLITGTDFSNGRINWESCYHISHKRYEEDPYIHLHEGDLLITKDGTIGKVALVKNMSKKSSLNSGIMLIRPTNGKFLTEYMLWVLQSIVFQEYINFAKSGTTIQHLYQETFENMPYPVPNIAEQRFISSYLDRKTNQIDSLIEKKQKMIELLKEERTAIINHAVTKGLNPDVKMKDSGLEWIGKIPEHWEVKKLKYTVSLINEKAVDFKNNVLRIALENIEGFTGKLINNENGDALFEGAGNRFKKGDVLFNKLRPYLCKAVFAPEDGVSVGELLVLRPNEHLDNKFLFYRVLSDYFISVVNGASYGTKMPRASWEFIGNLMLLLPPVTEQKAISAYLDQKNTDIDILIEKEKKLIISLQEFQTTLISEVVTGKIDVRDEVMA